MEPYQGRPIRFGNITLKNKPEAVADPPLPAAFDPNMFVPPPVEYVEEIDNAAEFEKLRRFNLETLARSALIFLESGMSVEETISILQIRHVNDRDISKHQIRDTVEQASRLLAKSKRKP
jgi:hypothetical protein